jgi:hypothetical protein
VSAILSRTVAVVLTVAAGLLPSLSPAEAASRPARPSITNLHVDREAVAIMWDHTLCSGCALRVAWRYGADSPYPTSYATASHHDGLGRRTFLDYGQFGRHDRTVYRLSFWAYRDGVYSGAVHREIRVPEYYGGLRAHFSARVRSSTSIALRLGDEFNPAWDNWYQFSGWKLWMGTTEHPSGRDSRPPDRPPVKKCIGHKCLDTKRLVLRNLDPETRYSISIFGYDRHGDARRSYQLSGTALTGFYVTGSGQTPGQNKQADHTRFALDGAGGRHVVDAVHHGDETHLTYRTRFRGDSGWTSNAVDGTFRSGFGYWLHTGVTTDGKKVYAVRSSCDGIYVTWASVTARRLPRPKRVLTPDIDRCQNDYPLVYAAGVVPRPSQQIEILAAGDYDVPWAPMPPPKLLIVTSDGSVSEDDAPATADVDVDGLSRDPVTGELALFGSRSDGTKNGRQTFAWTRATDGAWVGPVTIAEDTAVEGYRRNSADLWNGRIIVAFNRFVLCTSCPNTSSDGGVFNVTRSDTGVWSLPTRVPHTTNADEEPVVVTSPLSEHAHLAYKSPTGIRQTVQRDGSWSDPKSLTSWEQDFPTGLAFTSTGRTILGWYRSGDDIW